MDGYMTVKEASEKWGIGTRRVQIMCAEGSIEGITKFGKSWVIPADAERPVDGRLKSGKYRNWRKKNEEEIEKN